MWVNALSSLRASAASAVEALQLAWKFRRRLNITIDESRRYYEKALNLAVCYAGFSPTTSYVRFRLLGRAAFICTAYDVVTDWRRFDHKYFLQLNAIMSECRIPKLLQSIAIELYEREVAGTVRDNGLERGELTLQFICGLAQLELDQLLGGSEHGKLLGCFLQLVDDILDYEHDLAKSEQNSLTSVMRQAYLTLALSYPWASIRARLPHAYFLDKAVTNALRKARIMQSWGSEL